MNNCPHTVPRSWFLKPTGPAATTVHVLAPQQLFTETLAWWGQRGEQGGHPTLTKGHPHDPYTRTQPPTRSVTVSVNNTHIPDTSKVMEFPPLSGPGGSGGPRDLLSRAQRSYRHPHQRCPQLLIVYCTRNWQYQGKGEGITKPSVDQPRATEGHSTQHLSYIHVCTHTHTHEHTRNT